MVDLRQPGVDGRVCGDEAVDMCEAEEAADGVHGGVEAVEAVRTIERETRNAVRHLEKDGLIGHGDTSAQLFLVVIELERGRLHPRLTGQHIALLDFPLL